MRDSDLESLSRLAEHLAYYSTYTDAVMLANLAALTAQTQPVDYGYEEGSSIQTAAVAQLFSHLSHHHTRTQPGAAASSTVVTASTYTVLPIASHYVTGDR